MEGPSEKTKNSSVWLSSEQVKSMEHVGNIGEGHGRQLKMMRTADGRHFCELEKEPARQAATVMLLKGIVPVCDIMMVKDTEGVHYYSYIVPIENELSGGEHTDEIEADARVISLLFRGEHWGGIHPKNIRLDENSHAVFFDFDQTRFDLTLNKARVQSALQEVQKYHPAAISLIKDKFLTLKDQLGGEAGARWFRQAMEHVGYDAQRDDVPLTYEEYEKREGQTTAVEGENAFRANNEELLIRLRDKVDEILEALSEMK